MRELLNTKMQRARTAGKQPVKLLKATTLSTPCKAYIFFSHRWVRALLLYGRQGLFIQEGSGAQVRISKGRSDNEAQVMKSWGNKKGGKKIWT